MINETLKRDIRFLLSFVPATSVADVEPGLSPMFYLTGAYDKDIDLITKVEEIKRRYGVTADSNLEDFVD